MNKRTDLRSALAAHQRRCGATDMTDPQGAVVRCEADWTVDMGKWGKVCDQHAAAINAQEHAVTR